MTAEEYLEATYRCRRKNLRNLVETFETHTEAAKEIGISRFRISNLLTKDIAFPEKTARRIEELFGLEMGSLDRGIHA